MIDAVVHRECLGHIFSSFFLIILRSKLRSGEAAGLPGNIQLPDIVYAIDLRFRLHTRPFTIVHLVQDCILVGDMAAQFGVRVIHPGHLRCLLHSLWCGYVWNRVRYLPTYHGKS
jgi:hypothetical protein